METEDTSWMNQPRFSGEETKVCGNVKDDGIARETCAKPAGHVGNHANFAGTVEWYQSSMHRRPLAPHMQRVVAEKAALDEKLVKLADFIDHNYLFRQCSENEQDRLRRQRPAMQSYSDILAERIAAFPTPG